MYNDTCRYIPDTDFQYSYVSENEYRQIKADNEYRQIKADKCISQIHTDISLQYSSLLGGRVCVSIAQAVVALVKKRGRRRRGVPSASGRHSRHRQRQLRVILGRRQQGSVSPACGLLLQRQRLVFAASMGRSDPSSGQSTLPVSNDWRDTDIDHRIYFLARSPPAAVGS
jgi:hypothetical protein